MVQFEADEVNANVTYGMFQGEREDWDSERVFFHERRACSDWQNELLVAVLSWLMSTHFRPCTFSASRALNCKYCIFSSYEYYVVLFDFIQIQGRCLFFQLCVKSAKVMSSSLCKRTWGNIASIGMVSMVFMLSIYLRRNAWLSCKCEILVCFSFNIFQKYNVK